MRFEGFSEEGDRFFHELAARQDRDWFKAHKDEYESLWVQPMKALFEHLRPGLERAFKGMRLGPEKHFRLQRDLRFSKDKSPYKTYAAAMIPVDVGAGDDLMGGGPAALYLHLGTEDVAGIGHWMFTPSDLTKYRELVLDDRQGSEIARKAQALQRRGFKASAFETLKKPPRGVAPDHPRGWLLKLKGFGFELPKIPSAARHSPKLSSWLLEQVRLAAPLVMDVERARREWS